MGINIHWAHAKNGKQFISTLNFTHALRRMPKQPPGSISNVCPGCRRGPGSRASRNVPFLAMSQALYLINPTFSQQPLSWELLIFRGRKLRFREVVTYPLGKLLSGWVIKNSQINNTNTNSNIMCLLLCAFYMQDTAISLLCVLF